MAKVKTVFRCSVCGGTSPRWVGRCPSCAEWNSLVEELGSPSGDREHAATTMAVPIGEVDLQAWHSVPTGVPEVDRVLGGGLVPGSVTLVGGEPGVGKSTLLLQVAAAMTRAERRVLYVSAEESVQQVRLRAERLDTITPTLWLAAETAVPAVVAQVAAVSPDCLIIDSLHTLHHPDSASAPGSVTQVRECAAALVREAKARALATILVGHVTKDGALAGPRVVEHLVDTVLSFEGERHHALRALRVVKHRFGPTDRLGMFEMTGAGLGAVPDPSRLFLADRRAGVPGSVVVPMLDGHRPLLVEIQALVGPDGQAPAPRRAAQGVDRGRLSTVVAVLEQRVGAPLGRADVYASAIGGVRVCEPGADLAVALAIMSSLAGEPVPSEVVVCGEIGLGGELRQVNQCQRRLAEAARLGFTAAIVPRHAPDPPPGLHALRATTVGEAIALAGIPLP
ncbi:DNA repair protein RadA [Rhabdothermincola sp.]|uniref:DNA repair protein RadA n=1 Tax=Rhabdothermincola sp. TaxID=2820405 RepID=UPI002FE0734A